MQRVYGRKARRTARETKLNEATHSTHPHDTQSDNVDDHDSSPSRRKRRRIATEGGPASDRSPTADAHGELMRIVSPSALVEITLFALAPTSLESPPARGSPRSPSTPPATLDDSKQSPSKAPPVRPMRTYAGPSRSFLVTLPVPGVDLTDVLTQDQDEASQESYADLCTRWGVDKSDDDPLPAEDVVSPSRRLKRNSSKTLSQSSLSYNASGIFNDLKSITELRNKGESRRFMDGVGYLFEGLEAASAITLRRAR